MISPRIVEVKEGKDNFISITSVSSPDNVLFFKVKRSNPKVVDFYPKRGVVAFGKTSEVNIKFMNTNTVHGRVLIQLVSIGRSLCTGTFEKDWESGILSGIDMISKIVSIHRGDSHSTSLASTSCKPAVAPIFRAGFLPHSSDIRSLQPTLVFSPGDSDEPTESQLNLRSSLLVHDCDTNKDFDQLNSADRLKISSHVVEELSMKSPDTPKQVPLCSEITMVTTEIALSSQTCALLCTPAPADDRGNNHANYGIS